MVNSHPIHVNMLLITQLRIAPYLSGLPPDQHRVPGVVIKPASQWALPVHLSIGARSQVDGQVKAAFTQVDDDMVHTMTYTYTKISN